MGQPFSGHSFPLLRARKAFSIIPKVVYKPKQQVVSCFYNTAYPAGTHSIPRIRRNVFVGDAIKTLVSHPTYSHTKIFLFYLAWTHTQFCANKTVEHVLGTPSKLVAFAHEKLIPLPTGTSSNTLQAVLQLNAAPSPVVVPVISR